MLCYDRYCLNNVFVNVLIFTFLSRLGYTYSSLETAKKNNIFYNKSIAPNKTFIFSVRNCRHFCVCIGRV